MTMVTEAMGTDTHTHVDSILQHHHHHHHHHYHTIQDSRMAHPRPKEAQHSSGDILVILTDISGP